MLKSNFYSTSLFSPNRIVALLALGGVLTTTALCASPHATKQAHTATTLSAPQGAIVLFSGKADEVAKHWVKRYSDKPATWSIRDGAMVAGGGDIASKEEYANFHLHLEFKVPLLPNAKGQARGNSGIGLHSRYEVQILDSYGINPPGTGDCGAVYNQSAPLVNASKPPKEWQSYEIIFRAPRFDASGKKTENPRVTVIQNGMVVQNNQEIPNMTGIQFSQYKEMSKTGQIVLQDHGCQVEFRNVWILPLPAQGDPHY